MSRCWRSRLSDGGWGWSGGGNSAVNVVGVGFQATSVGAKVAVIVYSKVILTLGIGGASIVTVIGGW